MTDSQVRPDPVGSRRIARDAIVEFGAFLGSVAALQGTRFLYTIVVAAGVTPALFTGWTLFITFVGYAPALLLGAGNGMNRTVPILLGGGRLDEADDAEAATWMVVVIAVSVAVVAGLILVPLTDALVAAAAITGGLMAIYQVQQFTMRARLAFDRASYQQGAWAGFVAVGCLAISLIGVSLGAAVSVWALGLAGGVVAGVLLRRPRWQPGPPGRAIPLIVTGMPIMLAGLAGNMLYTIDRWVASATLGPAAAGAYGLASLVASAAFLVPMVIAQQQYPRLAMLHGAGASASQLEAALKRQAMLAAGGALAASLAITVFSAAVLPVLLPAYGAAVVPSIVLCVGLVALAASTGYGNAMVVTGALWRYLAIQLLCLTVAVFLMLAGSSALGPLGIALGTAAGQILLLLGVSLTGRVVLRTKAPPGA